MTTINNLKHVEWASQGLHPGWWFLEGFKDLGSEEQVAWLELLTLAINLYPSGRALFLSNEQTADLLDVPVPALATVLTEASKRRVLERVKTYTREDIRDAPLFQHAFSGQEDYFGRLEGVKFYRGGYEVTFPSLFTYSEPLEVGGWLVKKGPLTLALKRDLDAALERPLELLRPRIKPTPPDSCGSAETMELLERFNSARIDLYAWMSETLSGKSERVNLPELGN